MDNISTLNTWAAQFMGEEDDMVADAVEAASYTSNPVWAFSLLAKSAEEGKKIELEVDGTSVEVYCGSAEETGTLDELALLITRACYRCHNG